MRQPVSSPSKQLCQALCQVLGRSKSKTDPNPVLLRVTASGRNRILQSLVILCLIMSEQCFEIQASIQVMGSLPWSGVQGRQSRSSFLCSARHDPGLSVPLPLTIPMEAFSPLAKALAWGLYCPYLKRGDWDWKNF